MSIRVVGTGHIFERSVNEVREAIYEHKPGIVAVELDEKRFRALEEQNFSLDYEEPDVSLRDVLVGSMRGGSFPLFLQALLHKIQGMLGRQYGIKPGADMCAAILAANETGGVVALIDRDIQITLNHVLAIPFREKVKMFTVRDNDLEVVVGLMDSNIERILDEENLNRVMNSLRDNLPYLYTALVDERDRYMAYQLDVLQRNNPGAGILAVVGAGHKRGVESYLEKLSSGLEFSLRPLVSIRKVSFISVLFLIFAIIVAYVFLAVRFRER